MKKNKARENLREINKIIQDNRSFCWLTDGTLLGFVRENDFISHDHDTDIGIHYSDLSLKLIKNLTKYRYKVKTYGYVSNSLKIEVTKNNHTTDISVFYDLNQNYMYYSLYKGVTKRYDFYHSKCEFKKISFLDDSFYVPLQEEKYIIEKYGKTWSAVIKDWHYITSPSNRLNDKPIIIDVQRQKDEFTKWALEQKKCM